MTNKKKYINLEFQSIVYYISEEDLEKIIDCYEEREVEEAKSIGSYYKAIKEELKKLKEELNKKILTENEFNNRIKVIYYISQNAMKNIEDIKKENAWILPYNIEIIDKQEEIHSYLEKLI